MSVRRDLARLRELSFAQGDGPFTTQDVRSAGVPTETVARSLAAGLVVKVGRCSYVLRELWERADEWDRFRLRALGFGTGARADDHLTGWSAAVVHGFPTYGSPPEAVTAIRTRPTTSGTNANAFGRVRTGLLPLAHRWDRGRYQIVSHAYTAIDVARHSTHPAALVVCDHAMRRGVGREELSLLSGQLATYPGIELAAWAIEHADPRAETALESLGRLAFIEACRPAPISNVWIADGERHWRVDHLLPDSGVVLEGDGAGKLTAATDPHRRMRDQVIRESRLRALGYEVERYDFGIAMHHRDLLLHLAERAAARRGHRAVPTNWSMEPPAQLRDWFRRTQEFPNSA
ncbi:MAG: type IV toxin-antitoxin system AbiEi family antitoxin domain-containing protein [Williamsia herbipolensis]|nr:type IV toxin-antitoxin system AbiEi family antitoxin domain-containing protein [Williamsia herbipolensis]